MSVARSDRPFSSRVERNDTEGDDPGLLGGPQKRLPELPGVNRPLIASTQAFRHPSAIP